MLNYRLSRKLKLLGNCEFDYLTIILTFLSLMGLNFPLVSGDPTRENITF